MNAKEELLLRKQGENLNDSMVEICSLKSTGQRERQSYGLISLKGAGFVMVSVKVTRTTQVALTAEEVSFHLRMTEMGCPSFILVQTHPRGTKKTSLASLRLYVGSQVEDLYYRGTGVAGIDEWPLDAIQWHLLRWRLVE